MPREIASIYSMFILGIPRKMGGRELDNNSLQGASHFTQKEKRKENGRR